MPSLSQAKTFGGVGSILVLLTPIPYAGWVLGIAGFILTLIAIKNISDYFQDHSIFSNMLISVVLAIVGLIIGGVVVAAAIFRMVGLGSLTSGSSTAPTLSSDFVGAIAALVVGLAVIWIVFIISSYFLRKSYNSIATRLNIGMFRTAALVYFIGAILIILIGLGFLLILVAQILFIIAFFSIPETPPTNFPGGAPGVFPPPPPMPSMGGAGMPTSTPKFCSKCGASLAADAVFCPSCGAAQNRTM